MSEKLSFKEFEAALEAARKPRGSSKHPLSVAWANGELSRKQLGQWAIQHFYYIDAIPPQFAALYSRMPDMEGRHMLLENLIGEDMPDQPGKAHPQLLLYFAAACGLNSDVVVDAEYSGEILPTTRAMRSWIWELAKLRPLEEACAGIMVALEGQLPTLYPPYIDAMRKMGFTEEELEFFHVHVENDDEHAEVGLKLCYQYADTAIKQKRAIATVRASTEQRYSLLDGIYAKIKQDAQEAA